MWEDKRDFIFSILCLVGGGKMKGWEKMSLYKFTLMPLLKKWSTIKTKSGKQPKKKKKVALTQIY